MSLICVSNDREAYEYGWLDTVKPTRLRSCEEIQQEYCDCIEWEQRKSYWRMKENDAGEDPTHLFLESKEIQDYLALYGIEYVGNFLLEGTWNSQRDELSEEEVKKRKSKQFVTWLNYPLQLACLVLHNNNTIYVDEYAIDCLHIKYLKPVLEKRDLICRMTSLYTGLIEAYIRAGCDVIIDHESVTERFKNWDELELSSYLDNKFPRYITREADARAFDENIIKKFTPFTPRRILLSELEKECLGSERHWFLEEHPELEKTVYIENGESVYSDYNRRPPIYLLWLIDGAWYFLHQNSFKHPTYLDLVLQAAFSPEEFSPRFDESFDAASVEKVFALVLDVDEICDANEYWEYIGFYLKYDRRKNEIEICEKNSAMIEFHNLLQESTDLKDSLGRDYEW